MDASTSGKTRFTVELDFEVVKEFRVAVIKKHGQLRGHVMHEIEEALRARTRQMTHDVMTPRAPAFGAH